MEDPTVIAICYRFVIDTRGFHVPITEEPIIKQKKPLFNVFLRGRIEEAT